MTDEKPCGCLAGYDCADSPTPAARVDEPDLATELAERGLRACCGQPSEVHCR